MNQIIFNLSLLLLVYFLIRAVSSPIHLVFILGITGSNFFGSASTFQTSFLPGFTLNGSDIINIIIILTVIAKLNALKRCSYNKYFIIIITTFLFVTIFRAIVFHSDFILADFKNYIRYLAPLSYPYFFYLYLKKENYSSFLLSLKLLALLSIVVFFLQYTNLYFPITELSPSGSPEIYKIETLDINRFNILGGAFLLICSSLFIFEYLTRRDKTSLIEAVFVIIIFFLSTYRTSFIIVFLSVLFTVLFYERIRKKVFLLVLAFILVFFIIQALLPQYSFEDYWLRIQSAYTELKYSQGTALVRVVKTAKIWNSLNSNMGILFFGSYFTSQGREIFDYIALDLGIIATIALYGILFTTSIFWTIFKIFIKKYETNYSFVLRAYILASAPALIFNFELFYYFSNNILLLYGIVLAFNLNQIEEKQKQISHLNKNSSVVKNVLPSN